METTHDITFQRDFFFQTAAEGILLVDGDGYLRRLNPAAAAMLELSPDESLAQHSAALFKFKPDLLRLLNQPGEQQATITLPHKRIATGVGMDRPGGGRVVLLHDVTERHAVDSRREALIRQVAHDFRNPLNALSGYVELVGSFGDLLPQQQKFLDRVQQTAQKLYDLSATLVDLAWVEAGMALAHTPFELAHLIREAADELAGEARERDVTIVISIQDPIPPVIGDPDRIRQTVHALLANGVRYSHPDSNVAIHAWQDGPHVYCSVGDQGIGISHEDQEYVWDRLWRSEDERVRAVAGGGIGLTFARAIVERHGGRIWLDSDLNDGTIVTFVLPLAEGW